MDLHVYVSRLDIELGIILLKQPYFESTGKPIQIISCNIKCIEVCIIKYRDRDKAYIRVVHNTALLSQTSI